MSTGANFRLTGGSGLTAEVDLGEGGSAAGGGLRRLLLEDVSMGSGANLDLGFVEASSGFRLLLLEVSIGWGKKREAGFV